MSRHSRTLLTMMLITVGLILGCIISLPQKTDERARVHMLDVGQGDSFLIVAKNGKQLLIDGGKDSRVLSELARVMPRGDKSIDVVIATHPDADHIGGLSHILARYDVGLFLTSDVITDTPQFLALNKILFKKNIPAYYVRYGMNINLDSDPVTNFAILFPDRGTTRWETNSASVVGKLSIGERSVLFTGDAPASVEAFLVKALLREIDSDILKLGHHGSKTASSEIFLKATTPLLALVSAGVANSYGHPATDVVERLKKLNIPFVSTQDKGGVTLTTDGVIWTIQ